MTARRCPASLLLVLLFVLGQMLLGAGPAPAQPGPVPICHAGGDGSGAPDQPSHTPDCSLCGVCYPAAAGAGLPGPVPATSAPPEAIPARLGSPPLAHAPPRRPLAAACYPTGPPIPA